MSTIQPLRLKHPLQPKEPAAGFASRLAAVNGRPMNVLLRDMAIPPRSIDLGDREKVAYLAGLGGAAPSELLRYTPHRSDRNGFHLLAGETVGYRAVTRTFFRFCPHCIRDDLEAFKGPINGRPWLRLQWTVGYFRSCEIHRVFFGNTTPVRRRFEPFDFAETIAALLPTIDETCCAAQQASHSSYQAWLIDRLEGRRNPEMWLDRFPLYVGADVCEALGVSALHPPTVRSADLTEVDRATAAEAGFHIASGGEDAIHSLLKGLNSAQRHTRGFWGLRDTYGYVYSFLHSTRNDPEYQPIRELVRRFANETIPIEPGTNVLGVVIDKPGVVTVRTAARASGAHDRTIRRLIARKGLARSAIGDGLRNHRVVVTSSEIEEVIDKLKGALSGPQVSKKLGIPRLHLDALISIGALPTVTGSEKEAYAKHRFAVSEIDRMMNRLFDEAETVEVPGPRQLTIMEARHCAGASLETVLDMVFERKLAWKGRLAGRSDYGALLLDADEVTAQVRSEPPMQNFRKADVPKAVPGLSPLAIEPLIREGYLRTTTEFSPQARREIPVVTHQSVTEFCRLFVCLGDLARSNGLHHKQVKLLLKSVGIVPALNPEYVGVWLYDRPSIERLLVARPDFWKYDKAAAQEAIRVAKTTDNTPLDEIPEAAATSRP